MFLTIDLFAIKNLLSVETVLDIAFHAHNPDPLFRPSTRRIRSYLYSAPRHPIPPEYIRGPFFLRTNASSIGHILYSPPGVSRPCRLDTLFDDPCSQCSVVDSIALILIRSSTRLFIQLIQVIGLPEDLLVSLTLHILEPHGQRPDPVDQLLGPGVALFVVDREIITSRL